MCLLIESIRIYNRKVYSINLHNDRCNTSRKELFGSTDLLNLRKYIDIPQECSTGLVKCRIIYDRKIQSIEFSPYEIRKISSLKLVCADDIQYRHKLYLRPELDKIYTLRGIADEVIMVQKGLITDAYYYNIVISVNNKLLTPAVPLLQGIMRQKLLKQNKIRPAKITIEDLRHCEQIYLINALTPLGKITINPAQVYE